MHCVVKSWTDKLVRHCLEQLPFKVSRQEIPIHNLPEAFNGFVVAQVSDLHIDQWNRRITESAIDMINAIQPDLLVFTGDAIAESNEYLKDVTHLLRQMNARHGKMACLGNHDYSDYSGSYGVREALRRAGFDVLVNESASLEVNHQQIQIAGADDLILGRQCLNSTSRRLNREHATILLSHNPKNFDAMAHFRPDLILSGHTHGGQIQVPAKWHQNIVGPYVSGLYQNQHSRLYVNRGLGSAVFVHHWGERRISLPTPRLLVQPEISVFTLVNPVFEEKLRRKQESQTVAMAS